MLRKKVKAEAEESKAKSNGDGVDAMDVDAEGGVPVKEEIGGGDGGMVFTSTTEFSSRLEVCSLRFWCCVMW